MLCDGERPESGRRGVDYLWEYVEAVNTFNLLLRFSKNFQSPKYEQSERGILDWAVYVLLPLELYVRCNSVKLYWLRFLKGMEWGRTDCHLRWCYCGRGIKMYDTRLLLADGNFVLCGTVGELKQDIRQRSVTWSPVINGYFHSRVIYVYSVW